MSHSFHMFTTGVPRGESPHYHSGMSTDTGHHRSFICLFDSLSGWALNRQRFVFFLDGSERRRPPCTAGQTAVGPQTVCLRIRGLSHIHGAVDEVRRRTLEIKTKPQMSLTPSADYFASVIPWAKKAGRLRFTSSNSTPLLLDGRSYEKDYSITT